MNFILNYFDKIKEIDENDFNQQFELFFNNYKFNYYS